MFKKVTSFNKCTLRNISRATVKKAAPKVSTTQLNHAPGVHTSVAARYHVINKLNSNIRQLHLKQNYDLENVLFTSVIRFDPNSVKSAFDQLVRANIEPSVEMYACAVGSCLFQKNGQRVLFYLRSMSRQSSHTTVPPRLCQVAAKVFAMDNAPKEEALFAALGKQETVSIEELKVAVEKGYESPRYKLIVQ
jgi:hypothetical protein